MSDASSKSSKGRTALAGLIVLVVAALVVATTMAALSSWTHLSLAFRAVELSRASVTAQFSATAVEVGLLALAVSGALLAILTGSRDKPIMYSTGFFAVVSFLANVYAGLDALTNSAVTVKALHALSRLDFAVVIVGAGTLPVMVVVLTHVTITVCRQAREWWTGETATTTTKDDKTPSETNGSGSADAPALPNIGVSLADINRAAGKTYLMIQDGKVVGQWPRPQPEDMVAVDDERRGTVVTAPNGDGDPVGAYIAEKGEQHIDDVVKATGWSRAKVYGVAKAGGVRWRVERGVVKAA